MPFHIRRARKHFNEFLSKEQKCKGSAFQLLSDDTFQTGISPSGARGCQSSVHFAVKKGNTERGRVFAEVLSTRLWSAALKLSQQNQKQDFLYFFKQWELRCRKKESIYNWLTWLRAVQSSPPPPQFDWLACMTQRDRGGQKSTNRGFNKVVGSSVSQSKGPN